MNTQRLRDAIARAIAASDVGAPGWAEEIERARWAEGEVARSCAAMAAHGRAALAMLDRGDWLAALDQLRIACRLERRYGSSPTWSPPYQIAVVDSYLLCADGCPVGLPGESLLAIPLRDGETSLSLSTAAPTRLAEARLMPAEELARRVHTERWGVQPHSGSLGLFLASPHAPEPPEAAPGPTWSVRPDAHADAVIAFTEHDGVPVLIAEGGRYPTLVHADGSTTERAPHVLVSVGTVTTVTGAGPGTKAWTSASVSAVGGYLRGRRQHLATAQIDARGVGEPELRAAVEAALPTALAALLDLDETYARADARIAEGAPYFGRPLSREAYEAACAAVGVDPLPDAECLGYGVRYGEFSFPQYPADHVLRMSLAGERLRALEDEVRGVPVGDVLAPRHAWGTSGVRYDEPCAVCRQTATVDNVSGACQTHHHAAP